jgi:CheY-like chemotaxis protein
MEQSFEVNKMNEIKMRILITEDEYMIALDMKWVLEKKGFSVVGICASGEEAVIKAAQSKPDLILMDIVLKGKMDGIEAAKIISTKNNIPILFCTANCDSFTMQRLETFRHVGVINKPMEDEILLKSIRNFQNTPN